MSDSAPPSRPGITPARRAAYEVVRRTFEDDAWTDRAFSSAASRYELTGRALAHARWLAYGAVQRRGTTDAILAGLARRPARAVDPGALAAIRIGLYELCFADAAPDHAAVDQAVELAKAGVRRDGAPPARARAAAGFVNAILRRAADRREALLEPFSDATADGAAVALSYPEWLTRMFWDELGEVDARAVLRAMNEPAEAAFRARDAESIAKGLREDGVTVHGPGAGTLLNQADCLVIEQATQPVQARVETGALIPQSRASQAVVALLDPQPGERILDLCAGPGIKTTAIAARIADRGEVVSFEIDARRAAEIEELCKRTGAHSVRVEVGDAAEADLGSGYDRILVDPPCSDLGTLASRPDARWRKSHALIERLAMLQRRLLTRAARALAPGGTLVYSTCTISRRENEAVAGALGDLVSDIEVDDLSLVDRGLRSPSDHRFLQIRPDRDNTSGFFIARFRRA